VPIEELIAKLDAEAAASVADNDTGSSIFQAPVDGSRAFGCPLASWCIAVCGSFGLTVTRLEDFLTCCPRTRSTATLFVGSSSGIPVYLQHQTSEPQRRQSQQQQRILDHQNARALGVLILMAGLDMMTLQTRRMTASRHRGPDRGGVMVVALEEDAAAGDSGAEGAELVPQPRA